MAKAKYKIGQLVETEESFGKVTEIRHTEDGIQYMTSSSEEPITEDEVQSVWRPVLPRAAKGTYTRSARTRRSREAATSATQ